MIGCRSDEEHAVLSLCFECDVCKTAFRRPSQPPPLLLPPASWSRFNPSWSRFNPSQPDPPPSMPPSGGLPATATSAPQQPAPPLSGAATITAVYPTLNPLTAIWRQACANGSQAAPLGTVIGVPLPPTQTTGSPWQHTPVSVPAAFSALLPARVSAPITALNPLTVSASSRIAERGGEGQVPIDLEVDEAEPSNQITELARRRSGPGAAMVAPSSGRGSGPLPPPTVFSSAEGWGVGQAGTRGEMGQGGVGGGGVGISSMDLERQSALFPAIRAAAGTSQPFLAAATEQPRRVILLILLFTTAWIFLMFGLAIAQEGCVGLTGGGGG